MTKRNCFCGRLNRKDAGSKVIVAGWIKKRRDHGNLIFVDLGDRSGVVQLAFDPRVAKDTHSIAHSLREGWVIMAGGKVLLRPADSVNPKISTGEIEIQVEKVDVLNSSLPLPFSTDDEVELNEEVRLKYRYIDLRRPVMQRNMQLRYEVTKAVREFLDRQGFIEIETPFLTKSTPEGARDYLVPSRLNPGEFYALPQSPQLFKQIIMIAGFERYFQIVKCFRDEDLRADRQPEHTQIDIELSFIDEQDIFKLIEGMLKHVFEKTKGITIPTPFFSLSYEEAMERYGSDKPDTRFDMELKELSFLGKEGSFSSFQEIVKNGGCVKGITLPGPVNLSRRELDELKLWATNRGAPDLAWVIFAEKVKSPLAKFYDSSTLDKMAQASGAKKGDVLFMVAGSKDTVCKALGQLRIFLARKFNFIPEEKFNFVWIVDFPLFERNETGRLISVHHPFTSPCEENIPILETNPDEVTSRAYDIVLNGQEIGGGSIRIHKKELQEKIFKLLGMDEVRAREKFGFLLDALSLGAPPHGGIAMGLDRLVMILAGEKSIREVIPFPKTQKAVCLMTQAPSPVEEEQLRELHIEIRED
ncbi:aspartate--tRNA ligase [Candidatus Aerophobetes bacterium]|nr:aspartate--tRNA ligase [Candidatus Aerophobetes bacterium]